MYTKADAVRWLCEFQSSRKPNKLSDRWRRAMCQVAFRHKCFVYNCERECAFYDDFA